MKDEKNIGDCEPTVASVLAARNKANDLAGHIRFFREKIKALSESELEFARECVRLREKIEAQKEEMESLINQISQFSFSDLMAWKKKRGFPLHPRDRIQDGIDRMEKNIRSAHLNNPADNDCEIVGVDFSGVKHSIDEIADMIREAMEKCEHAKSIIPYCQNCVHWIRVDKSLRTGICSINAEVCLNEHSCVFYFQHR